LNLGGGLLSLNGSLLNFSRSLLSYNSGLLNLSESLLSFSGSLLKLSGSLWSCTRSLFSHKNKINLKKNTTKTMVDMPSNRLVMKKVTVNDGQDLGAAFDSPNLTSEYIYEDGYFDREEKEFFGFGTFTIKHPDGAKTT
jgi:hypothetical protein